MHKDEMRRANWDNLFYACEQAKQALIIAENVIDVLYFTNQINKTSRKQKEILNDIISQIYDVQCNIEETRIKSSL